MQRSAIDTSRSSRTTRPTRPWAKEGRPANLQGHGLDHIRDPEVDDILAHGAGAGEGGRDQHLLDDQDLYLFVDHDPLHSDDLDLVL